MKCPFKGFCPRSSNDNSRPSYRTGEKKFDPNY
jgi:hypothetical protein